jgi:hypothetical protein
MNKPVCTVMVGLPALGKSTFIKSIKTADTWIYSTDMFMEFPWTQPEHPEYVFVPTDEFPNKVIE